jgi:GT2 family glycosyltransferase
MESQETCLLSVVIVNFNVRYFLEQCLDSVAKALENLAPQTAEVFVVDNASVDGSQQMVKDRFPWCHLIENSENVGFSRANNQAIRISGGRYILLLNPDTLIQPDTLSRVCAFMEEHPEAGALGVRMVDGRGRFLPESKRGLPTPLTAFFKVFGLSALFPQSRLFGRYHLRYLDEFQVHAVDVLSGAFMLIRRSALKKAGLLDEDFFMYGEDIDLSYRLQKAGYTNYYYPLTTIIHYKGESTKKGSLNYVRVFYQAMIIFAEKHFSGSGGLLFRWLIRLAVALRAFLAVTRRLVQAVWLPAADALLAYGLMLELTTWWAVHMKSGPDYYPEIYKRVVIPAYLAVWLLSAAAYGAYGRAHSTLKLLRGLGVGTLIILAVYALLPEHWRFSRALILSGAAGTFLVMLLVRLVKQGVETGKFFMGSESVKKVLLVARANDFQRMRLLLKESGTRALVQAEIPLSKDLPLARAADLLKEAAHVLDAEEIIFSGAELSSDEIIQLIDVLSNVRLEFKIAPPESEFIIGSHSANRRGELYVMEVNALSAPENRLRKRCVDIGLSLFILLLTPVLALACGGLKCLIKNIMRVLKGHYSWVGPQLLTGIHHHKPSVLPPWQGRNGRPVAERFRLDVEKLYLRDYLWWNDIIIVLRNLCLITRCCPDQQAEDNIQVSEKVGNRAVE